MKKQVVTDPNNVLFDDLHFKRSCQQKKKYTTEYQALFEIDLIKSRKPNLHLSYYKCPYCKNFHLTER